MIHIDKDFDAVPAALQTPEIEQFKHWFLADGTGSRPPFPKVRVDRSLGALYRNKCAYCESRATTVLCDTYRPRNAYPWLACEWSHLLPICSGCDQRRRSRFPLEDEAHRVVRPGRDFAQWRADSAELLAERPLLLHPEIDDPREFIGFHPDGRIYAIGGNRRGSTTIDTFDLNRQQLVQERTRRLHYVQGLWERALGRASASGSGAAALAPTLAEMEDLTASSSPYAGFLRFLLEHSPHSLHVPDHVLPLLVSQRQSPHVMKARDSLLPPAYATIQPIINAASDAVGVSSLAALRVDRLTVQNVKCFGDVTLDLNGESALIIGINGRGKTTLARLVALGLTGISHPSEVAGMYDLRRFGADDACFALDYRLDAPSALSFAIGPDDVITSDPPFPRDLPGRALIAAYGPQRNVTRDDAHSREPFSSVASLFGNNGHLKRVRDSTVFERLTTGFAEIQTLVNRVFALADGMHTVALHTYNARTFLFRTHTDPDGRTPLEALSDGFRAMFAWLFDMVVRIWEKGATLDRARGVVIVDEIDLHLHPTWQRRLLPALFATFPDIQFIFTTHSGFIVQSMDRGQIWLLAADDDAVSARKLEFEGRPDGYVLERIITEFLGAEHELVQVSESLHDRLVAFREAAKRGDTQTARDLARAIRAMIPGDSDFHDYLDIVGAGLVDDESDNES